MCREFMNDWLLFNQILSAYPSPGVNKAQLENNFLKIKSKLAREHRVLKDMLAGDYAIDGNAIAEEVGNPLALNMVMLGALIGSGTVPIGAEDMKGVLSTFTKKAFLEANLKAFDLGVESARRSHSRTAS